MAYRKLYDGDLVKVVKQMGFVGRNAIVIDAGLKASRIQITPWVCATKAKTECITVPNDHLMIRHEPNGYITDGRVDQAKYDAFMKRQSTPYGSFESEYLDDEDSEFDGLDHDDLVDMIVKLRNDVNTFSNAIVDKDEEITRLKMEIEGL